MRALDRVIMRHLLNIKVADEQPIVIGGDETNGKQTLRFDNESERCYNTDRLVWRTIKGNKVLVKSETGQIMSGPDELKGSFVGKKKKPYNLQKKAKVCEPESINIPNDEYKKVVSQAIALQTAKDPSEYIDILLGDYKYTCENDVNYDLRIVKKERRKKRQ